MKIDIISVNINRVGVSPKKPLPPFLKGTDRDIYVEFTQEDARRFVSKRNLSYDKTFNETLVNKSELNGMSLIVNEALNVGSTDQNIFMTIYLKNSLANLITRGVYSGSIPLAAGKSKWGFFAQSELLGFSKGAVWAKIYFQNYSLLFVNMHLPVDKNKENMGVDFRREKFIEILNKIRGLVENDTYVIIGGDLNFRMSRSGVDQLDELLRTIQLPIQLQELPYPQGKSAMFTCKFKENTASTNCRTTRIANVLKGRSTESSCFDKKRIPSRCDRFLIGAKPGIKVLDQDSFPFIHNSDHNAIYASIDIENTVERKKSRRSTRKVRRK
jgi:exonuclease III